MAGNIYMLTMQAEKIYWVIQKHKKYYGLPLHGNIAKHRAHEYYEIFNRLFRENHSYAGEFEL